MAAQVDCGSELAVPYFVSFQIGAYFLERVVVVVHTHPVVHLYTKHSMHVDIIVLACATVGQYVMLNLFIAVVLEYYQREQDSTEPFLQPEAYKIFQQIWTDMVGRDYDTEDKTCYEIMPVELFDELMTNLPALQLPCPKDHHGLGWTQLERESLKLKQAAYLESALSKIPVRFTQTLVHVPKDREKSMKDRMTVADKPPPPIDGPSGALCPQSTSDS